MKRRTPINIAVNKVEYFEHKYFRINSEILNKFEFTNGDKENPKTHANDEDFINWINPFLFCDNDYIEGFIKIVDRYPNYDVMYIVGNKRVFLLIPELSRYGFRCQFACDRNKLTELSEYLGVELCQENIAKQACPTRWAAESRAGARSLR